MPLLLTGPNVHATVTMSDGTQHQIVDTPALAYRKITSVASAPVRAGNPIQVAFTLLGVAPLQARGDNVENLETVILDVSQVVTVG